MVLQKLLGTVKRLGTGCVDLSKVATQPRTSETSFLCSFLAIFIQTNTLSSELYW